MIYPTDFKERVKAAYPNLPKLYEYMELGDRYMVKQFLEAGIEMPRGGIPYKKVLEATSLKELQSYAKLQEERKNLLNWYIEIDREDRRKLFIHHMG